jgi:hypothetical protein
MEYQYERQASRKEKKKASIFRPSENGDPQKRTESHQLLPPVKMSFFDTFMQLYFGFFGITCLLYPR